MRLRIATFNLENLDLPRKGRVPLEDRFLVLRPQLRALNADVLCLQEVNAQVDGQKGQRTLRALDRLVEGTPYGTFERAMTRGSSGGPADVHNLVVLSRLPIAHAEQHWHDEVSPPKVSLSTARREEQVRWDRPVLEVHVTCPDGAPLVVFDAHLRAPIAAHVEGQKLASLRWRSAAGWAEGYFMAAIKRVGQALELRKHVDRILDRDAEARIVVAGDLNADAAACALRILTADVEDTGNPDLLSRSLVPLEDRLPVERRYTVVHRGRRHMLDHLLASQSIARMHVATEVLNDDLLDEYEAGKTLEPLGSLHAPLVAELAWPDG
jgi:endonuclease/exonuclease/phosphatase family metal-dependent hydrolase